MIVDGTNLSMTRGDSESISVVVQGHELKAGDLVEMTVRRTVNSKVVVYKRVAEFADNAAVISILPEDTSGLNPAEYVYDIQLTYDGAVKTIIKPSKFTITPEVTYGTNS